MVRRGALAEFVDDLQAGGRLTFTRDEAMAALGVSPGALKQAALRLSKRQRLAMPRRGFFVVIPLEWRDAGAPPIATWLPGLLRFHGVRGGDVVETGGETVVVVDRPVRVMRWAGRVVRFRVGAS